MTTCGYICPQCEGRGFLESGETCDWCAPTTHMNPNTIEVDDLPKKELPSED
ncbi:MAG: hypothetical protein MUE96_11650 [Bacteroidia bacterium]|jgi:hypothetical protein|nr:hypothetical protein [Bacteroidia bacterium]